jgi:hypothetical protein
MSLSLGDCGGVRATDSLIINVPYIWPGIKFAVETESEHFRQIVPVGVPAQDDTEHATGKIQKRIP